MRELLETRLWLAQAWNGRLEALETSLIQRLFISMPRSGSTFLREFLAKDAENRAPRVWEVMFPVPAQNGVGVPFFLKRKQANHSPQKPNLKKTDYQPHIYP